jgi:hypothetical protein
MRRNRFASNVIVEESSVLAVGTEKRGKHFENRSA